MVVEFEGVGEVRGVREDEKKKSEGSTDFEEFQESQELEESDGMEDLEESEGLEDRRVRGVGGVRKVERE